MQLKSMRTYRAPEYGCTGLCAGDGCDGCARLADLITWAKTKPHGPERDAWLRILDDRVADVMGATRG